MGELRTKERGNNDRAYIGLRDGKQDKTVIVSLSISHVSALLLNGLCWRPTQPNDPFGLKRLGYMNPEHSKNKSEWHLLK